MGPAATAVKGRDGCPSSSYRLRKRIARARLFLLARHLRSSFCALKSFAILLCAKAMATPRISARRWSPTRGGNDRTCSSSSGKGQILRFISRQSTCRVTGWKWIDDGTTCTDRKRTANRPRRSRENVKRGEITSAFLFSPHNGTVTLLLRPQLCVLPFSLSY